MSTRGLLGFRINDADHLTYNHSDSYPSWLGIATLKMLRKHVKPTQLKKLQAAAEKLKPCVGTPTPADIKALAPYTDLGVNEQSTSDWYCLTRLTQGNLIKIIEAGYMREANDFIYESLYCEWGYIINFDTGEFEVYKGFQKKKHKKGRYGTRPPEPQYKEDKCEFWGCALVVSWPLTALPTDDEFFDKTGPKR